LEVAIFRFAVDPNEPIRFRKWQSAQEKIVDEREDGGIRADPQREREHREKREAGRFEQPANGEAEGIHGEKRSVSVGQLGFHHLV
jgi:hypothetical protein